MYKFQLTIIIVCYVADLTLAGILRLLHVCRMRNVVLGLLSLVSYHCAAHGGLIYIVPSHEGQASCDCSSTNDGNGAASRCLTVNDMWGNGSASDGGGWVPVSDTTLSFLPGRHVVNFSRLIEFRDISNFTLTGAKPANASNAGLNVQGSPMQTEIFCAKPAGFYFLNVSQLMISHLVFTKCGIDSVGGDLIKNTFRIYANSFLLFNSLDKMAVTVASVTDLTISSVTVQNSTGFGLLIVNLFGNSIIENSKFIFNNYYTYSSLRCNSTASYKTAPNNYHICTGANIGIGFVDPPQCSDMDNPPVYSLNITSTVAANGINLTPYALGGGIIITMSQTAYGMHVYMDNVTSINNVARVGANFAFHIYSVVDNSSVSIQNSFSGYSNPTFRPSVLTILSGTQFVGGGLFFSYGRRLPSGFRPSCKPRQKHSHANLLTITDMEFARNKATLGGAIVIDFSQSNANIGIVTLISFKNCSFRDNIGSRGSALYINQLQPVENVLLAQFLFENCKFWNNTYPVADIPNSFQQFELDLLNTVHLITVQYSSFIDCSFEDNIGSAMYVYDSLLRFNGNIHFVRNSGVNGGGMSLHGSSIMLLTPNTTVTFLNNSAQFRGGGMFISSENYRSSLLCFWQLESSTVNNQTLGGPALVLPINRSIDSTNIAKQLNIQITFNGNTASSAGNAIYGGAIDRCFLLPTANIITDQRSRMIFNQMFAFQGSKDNTSLISSSPSRLCICNHMKPVCNTSNPNITLFSGQVYEIYAIAIGQRNGTSPGVVFGTFLHDRTKEVEPAALQPSETTQQVGKNCTKLSYTILSTQLNTELRLLLALENSNVQSNPTVVTIRLLPCPPGFNLSSDSPRCQCHPVLVPYGVTCDITTETVHRVPPIWFSKDSNDPKHNSLLVYDYCPYDYCIPDKVSTNLSQADTLCAFNRSGIICGGCQSGFSLTLGTNECEVCTNSYLALLIPFAIAGLLLVVLLLLFNSLTVSVGAINGLIFYANILQVNKGIFFPPGHSNPMTTFIAWLNLDLGIKTCFYDGMDQYAKTWLQFAFPIYLWTLLGIIILLGHNLSSVAKLLGDEAVPVLATVFLLSVAKLQRTIIISLSFATVTHSDSSYSTMWYNDANIQYLKGKHIYLFVLSLATLLFIMLPFILALLFVTCLQALSAHRFFHWVNRSKPLFDAYIAPYKDKYRYWTGFLLFARSILLIAISVVDPRLSLLLITVSMQLLSAFAWVGGGVYKQWPLNALEFSFFANLGILSAATLFVQHIGGNQGGAIYISTTLAFLEFLGIMIFAIFLHLNSYFKWNISLDLIKEKLSKLVPITRKRALTDTSENLDEKIYLSASRDFSLVESTVIIDRGDSNSLEGTCSVSVELREPLLESGDHTL